MAEAPLPDALPDLDVAIDPDFEPQKRPRSCTWPLPRPDSGAVKPESNDIIPEEEDDEEDATTPSARVNGCVAAAEDQSSNSPVGDGALAVPRSGERRLAALLALPGGRADSQRLGCGADPEEDLFPPQRLGEPLLR
ncbi:Forkhead box protein O1 [Oryzias melastigma]|uniref:Forkhead box protein O1 n=1 Tax=Oryzias melastigma TaxID=30732 RepID=A0A834FNS8_ORYME|nr:Forkhead box protein O1 [Oryzias melastigma]